MKKINDSRIYLIAAIAALFVALVLAPVSFYSILIVEPEIDRLLNATEDTDANYKRAYLKLRSPQIFAGYENFDIDGISVKNSLAFFDKRVYYGAEIDAPRKAYLELLLDRRKKGSALGRNTMVFFVILSLIFWGVFFQEQKASGSRDE
ncbi:MAG: hypothetical protein E4G96_00045 [Chrysiogenales bacterium]|nr:MAG: hypothetical protein E4G96_00045 [Chrysiogenales bacterium]